MTTLPKTPSFRLDGRRALVTGASRGIGLGAAVALAEAGAHVVLAARGVESLAETVDAFKDAGFAASALALDVSDPKTACLAVETEIVNNGPFNVLVNNAGLARHSAFLDTEVTDFDAVVNVNVKGAYFVAQCVARAMVEHKIEGSIIHTSSQMGQVGGQDRAVYAATKHAIEGLTKSMAIELGVHNIRVNTLAPTFIKTPLTESTFSNPERLAWIKSKIKLNRIGEVEDIMGAVLFLASDASAMVTGIPLLVDAGWTAD
ncbi:MAG: SDR family oxidoreductase [Hyphomicrobiales bacterium]